MAGAVAPAGSSSAIKTNKVATRQARGSQRQLFITLDTRVFGNPNDRRCGQHIDQAIQHPGFGAPIQVPLILLGAVPVLDKHDALTVTLDVNLEILTTIKTSCIRQNLRQEIEDGLTTTLSGFEIDPYYGHDVSPC